jgi:hypothetical protein
MCPSHKEEHSVSVFEDGVLRRILGCKRVQVTGDWRKLCNEEHEVSSACALYKRQEVQSTLEV